MSRKKAKLIKDNLWENLCFHKRDAFSKSDLISIVLPATILKQDIDQETTSKKSWHFIKVIMYCT